MLRVHAIEVRLCFVILLLLSGRLVLAQQPASQPVASTSPQSTGAGTTGAAVSGGVTDKLNFVSSPVAAVLGLYETLTEKRLILDSVVGSGPPLTIQVPGEVPIEEAIRLIEASLLLNGYSFVDVDKKTVKILGPTRLARSQGIPIISSPSMLPEGEQIVTYFMKLSYLPPTEAAQLFGASFAPNPNYTSITPVPNAQAILITENTSVIRKLIQLKELVDVPPATVETKWITLKRADAEKVVETLQTLLENRDENAAKTAAQQGQPPQVDAQGQVIQASLGAAGGAAGQFETNLVVGETRLVADPRTNRILVVTRRDNFPYIEKLIEQLDAPVPLDAVLERPLKFVASSDVLPVLADLLSEGDEEGGAGASAARPQGGAGEGGLIQSGTGQGIGAGDGLGGGGGLGTSRPDRIREPAQDTAPQSIIVGKTKIIGDPAANSIIVIGPPDSRQKAAQILDMLDVRPRQVYIAAVIGELNLADEMEFGFSYFLRFVSNGAGTGAAGSLINPLSLDPGGVLAGSNLPSPSNLIRPQLFQNLQGLTVYGTIADAVDVYARALESTGKFKVLSRPVVYTSNNKKAVISSGQQVPFVSSTLASSTITTQNTTGITSNITYKDVLLKLEVLPLINANKDVTLVIVQTKNDVLRFENLGGNQTPIIGSQELTTTVTVPNGGTVVLGGLIVERMETGDSGLPFLMRIPVIGYLFKQTSRKVQRQELLVLLQPTVVESNEDLAKASWQERYRSDVGDDAYAEAAPSVFANTPVVFDAEELDPDSKVRKRRDPLRPAGIDYEEYAPAPKARKAKNAEAPAPEPEVRRATLPDS